MGGDAKPPFELKGWQKYFNSYTTKGRMNVRQFDFYYSYQHCLYLMEMSIFRPSMFQLDWQLSLHIKQLDRNQHQRHHSRPFN